MSELEEKTKLLLEEKLKNLDDWELELQTYYLSSVQTIKHKSLPIEVKRTVGGVYSMGIEYATFKGIHLDIKLVNAVFEYIRDKERELRKNKRDRELQSVLDILNNEE